MSTKCPNRNGHSEKASAYRVGVMATLLVMAGYAAVIAAIGLSRMRDGKPALPGPAVLAAYFKVGATGLPWRVRGLSN